MGEGGIIVPPDGYLTQVQKICSENNVLLIADEVQTGFGRCGRMFASELWNLRADIMTMAKALAGGLPIGAFIATDEVAKSLESGDHFSTFGGNPVCCAVALENLAYLQDQGLVKNSERMGKIMVERLLEMQKKHKIIGDVRGRGLMIGVELVKDKQSKQPAAEQAEKVAAAIQDDGVLIGTGGVLKNVLRMQPPLCISEEQTARVLDKLNDRLGKL